MCLTLQPSELSSTLLLAHSVEVEGVTVNVLGYQNQATNRSNSPNAMLLPFPSREHMSAENCIDMSAAPKVLSEYSRLFLPQPTRGLTKGGPMRFGSLVEVFDSGSYTVVLAANASDISSALDRVPKNKRPAPHPEIFDAYRQWYPDWPVALCCWDGTIKAEPLLWWYRPLTEYRDQHFLPGLDGHDGRVPDPARKSVAIDHTIMMGCARHNGVQPNAARILRDVPPHIARWLPEHVCGERFDNKQAANGDWVVPKEGLNFQNAKDRLRAPRAKPPGFTQMRG